MELRPLGFGEIFDRAITLYVRNFVPFVALVLVLIVPLAILQYIYAKSSAPDFDYYAKIFSHPRGVPPPHVPAMLSWPAGLALLGVMLVGFLLWPFALNAVAVGVARVYRNRPIDFRSCYAVVLARWLPILGLLFIEGLMLGGGYVALILVVVIVVAVIAALTLVSQVLAFWIGFVIGLAAGIAALIALAPLFVALTFAMYAIVIEDRTIGDSLALGFTRVFNRAEFWRAFLFAIASFAIVACSTMLFDVIALAAAFLHQPGLETLIDALWRATVAPFSVVLMAVYYFDVRIRREGYDLEASLERLTAAQASA